MSSMRTTGTGERRRGRGNPGQCRPEEAPLLPTCGAPVEASQAPLQNMNILKEIFPDHAKGMEPQAFASPAKGRVPMLERLLGTLPSPARAGPGASQHGTATWSTVPCGPPAHTPTIPIAPLAVPPPPLAPAPVCASPEKQCDAPLAQASLEAFAGSYRDRLRAGGQGALQRGFNNGLMPKAMKQDWSTTVPMSNPPAVVPQLPEVQTAMQYDSQQMWSCSQGIDCWDNSMLDPQQQMAAYQYPQMQQYEQQQSYEMQQMMSDQQFAPQMQQQAFSQMPMQGMQMQQTDMQMTPMMQADQSPYATAHLQLPQLPQMQFPQTPLSPMSLLTPTTASGDSTPADMDRFCMSIVMPQEADSTCDKELMALQLRAAAESCQRYED